MSETPLKYGRRPVASTRGRAVQVLGILAIIGFCGAGAAFVLDAFGVLVPLVDRALTTVGVDYAPGRATIYGWSETTINRLSIATFAFVCAFALLVLQIRAGQWRKMFQ